MRFHENTLPPRLPKNELVALDTELYKMERKRLHRPGGTLACLSIAVDDDVWQVYSEKDIAAAIHRVSAGKWILQKGDFDFRQLRARGIPVPPRRYHDTYYIELVLFNNLYSLFGLDSLSRRWLQKRLDKESRELFFDADRMTKEMQRYAAQDALTTYQVAQAQRVYIRSNGLDEMVERAWYQTDMETVWTILDMQGVCIDQKAWAAIADEQEAIMEKSLAELDYNPGSPKDVGARLLAEGLKLPKTPTGQPSTKEEYLAPYADKSETVRQVLEYRRAQKFSGTYGRNFFNFIEGDGRIHAGWNPIGTETFRLACELPNLQNIPKRDAVWGPRYRRAFIPAHGNVYVKVDYVQCQVAVMAGVSDDQPFKEAFEKHQDVHAANAAWIFNVPIDKVTKEQRSIAKGTTFGIIFNEGAGALAANVGTTRREAQKFIDDFMRTHWGYAQWKRKQLCNPEDFVVGPGGHRIWINPYVGKHADNNRLNSPIQEGEGAIHKRAAAKFRHQWNPAWGSFGLVLLVHDEMVVEVPKRYSKACARLIESCSLGAEREVLPDVQPAVDVEVCRNWYGDKL